MRRHTWLYWQSWSYPDAWSSWNSDRMRAYVQGKGVHGGELQTASGQRAEIYSKYTPFLFFLPYLLPHRLFHAIPRKLRSLDPLIHWWTLPFQVMICAQRVFRCFKWLERLGDRVTGAAGPLFVFLAVVLLSTGTVAFCEYLHYLSSAIAWHHIQLISLHHVYHGSLLQYHHAF